MLKTDLNHLVRENEYFEVSGPMYKHFNVCCQTFSTPTPPLASFRGGAVYTFLTILMLKMCLPQSYVNSLAPPGTILD